MFHRQICLSFARLQVSPFLNLLGTFASVSYAGTAFRSQNLLSSSATISVFALSRYLHNSAVVLSGPGALLVLYLFDDDYDFFTCDLSNVYV